MIEYVSMLEMAVMLALIMETPKMRALKERGLG